MIPMSCQALTLKASILMTHSLQGSSRAITQLHFPQSFIQLDIPIFIKHNIAELFLFPSGLFQVPLICSELFWNCFTETSLTQTCLTCQGLAELVNINVVRQKPCRNQTNPPQNPSWWQQCNMPIISSNSGKGRICIWEFYLLAVGPSASKDFHFLLH